jgi:hypothetical protein
VDKAVQGILLKKMSIFFLIKFGSAALYRYVKFFESSYGYSRVLSSLLLSDLSGKSNKLAFYYSLLNCLNIFSKGNAISGFNNKINKPKLFKFFQILLKKNISKLTNKKYVSLNIFFTSLLVKTYPKAFCIAPFNRSLIKEDKNLLIFFKLLLKKNYT